jgi:hypothetical protein
LAQLELPTNLYSANTDFTVLHIDNLGRSVTLVARSVAVTINKYSSVFNVASKPINQAWLNVS